MDKKEKRQEKILSEINKIFEEIKVASRLRLMENEPDLAMNVLQVLHNDFSLDGKEVLGEYGFSPASNIDDVQYFVASLILMEDVPEENITDLLAAVGLANFFLVSGCFALDVSERELIYKNTVPLLDSMTDEQMVAEINVIIVNGLDFSEQFAYLLTEVGNGNINLDQFMDALADELKSNKE